ncbi:response regulator, partial [bacterium]|nr:response regulator [bacterium]
TTKTYFCFSRLHPKVSKLVASEKSILIIDEEQEFREILRAWLMEDGWTVYEAEDGEEGLAAIRKFSPHVVICDLLMPRCNGFSLCRQIHADKAIAHTKIIISSSRGYAGDRLSAMQCGADEYLVKPYQEDELFNILIRMLEPEKSAFVKFWERVRPSDTGLTPETKRHTQRISKASTAPTAQEERAPESHNDSMKIRFWGVRGSTPTPGPSTVHYGGNTSCVEIRADGELIILDAGSGIRPCGQALVKEFKDEPISLNLLLTHTHWDHIQGFPFFIPAYNPRNKITVRGFEGSFESLAEIFDNQMKAPYFPISMAQMASLPEIVEIKDMEFNIGKVHVQAKFMNHPGICVGYRINSSSGSVAFMPDNEPYQRLRGTTDSRERITEESLAYARKMDEQLVDWIRDVDVLIIDSQYDDSEYQSKVGWGHGCLDDVVSLALLANVKQLYLFHHDPDHDDAHITRMTQWARDLVAMHGDPLQVEASREGLEIDLMPQF